MTRVVLAMSGGVDSSASAVLLQQQGYEVVGLFMRSGSTEAESCAVPDNPLPIINAPTRKQGCCSASDAADARRVADLLDIPFHALNFKDEFKQIKDYFVEEYLAARTPNPCVMCNNWLKFGHLWDFAKSIGAEKIATGHYARLIPQDDGTHALTRGQDPTKDQSYVLFGINNQLLDKILFPCGDRTKIEIRELAREAGLRNANKPDSQEICFIPDNDYAAFIERYHGESDTAGELVTTTGEVVGQHEGYERFTIGQRKGLGIAFGEPRFVVRIERETKRVVIGEREDLATPVLEADRLNWLVPAPTGSIRCKAMIRYRHEAAPATAEIVGDALRVQFDEPQFGVAPGQAVVLYDDNRVLGGGWIARGNEQKTD